ncbi:hypothetical protein C8R45DRAFT_1157248 [Mycena sanguinolenta]|nr:hypothetical protein C8R45DRAFT_1157248 [Mycena sanguinolenta]
MTARRDDLPAVLNSQPRLLGPRLSFNAIRSLPAILPFRVINALRRRCEPSYPRPRRAELKDPKLLPLAAVVHAHRSNSSLETSHPTAARTATRACPSAMSHTVKLRMEHALCAFLVHPTYVPLLLTRISYQEPTFTIQIRPRSVLKPQPRLLLVAVPRALDVRVAHLGASTFSAARCSSFSSSSDDAAVSPSRIRRGTAVRAHRRGEQACVAAAGRVRMMEADDGGSQEYARPRIAAHSDDPSTRIRRSAALRRLTPRMRGTSSARRRSCRSRAREPFPYPRRAPSAPLRSTSNSSTPIRIHAARALRYGKLSDRVGAALLSSFLRRSIAIFLDLCDTARSHADSAARMPEHAGNHAREVALEVGAAAVPLYDGGRLCFHSSPSDSMLRLPGRNLAQPTSVAVDDRPRMALALSLDNTAAASPLALAFGVALLGDPRAPAATAVRRRGRLPRTARCPRASTIAPCVSPASPSPIVAPRVPGRGEALPFVDALAHDRRRCSFPLASPADAAVRPAPRWQVALKIALPSAALAILPLSLRCPCPGVGGSSCRLHALRVDVNDVVPTHPSSLFVCTGREDNMLRDIPHLAPGSRYLVPPFHDCFVSKARRFSHVVSPACGSERRRTRSVPKTIGLVVY